MRVDRWLDRFPHDGDARPQRFPFDPVTGAATPVKWPRRCVTACLVKDLSIREDQIIRLVAQGMTTKTIAATLSIAESTVNWHVGNALAKLGASSRAEAVAIVLRDGGVEAPVVIVQPPPRRRIGWWLAAAAAAVLVLGLAGGTSVATWYFGTHRDEPTPRGAPTTPAASATATAIATATARPSVGDGGQPTAAPSSDPSTAGPAVAPPQPLSSAAPLTVPVATPVLTPPIPAPVVTAPPLPSLPPLPTAPVPQIRRILGP